MLKSNTIVIKETQDALDLMADAGYHDSHIIIINAKNIIPEFFDLKSGIAGEILQKFSTNNVQLAIVKCNQIMSYLEARNDNKLNTLIQNVRVIKQCFDFYLNGPSSEIRDKYMAENLSWILENNPNSKIVLWAHNGHISKQRGGMGNYISKKFGDQYYSIGFLTNKGKYTGGRQNSISTDNKFVESRPGSFEFNFGKTKIPYFFLDLYSIDCKNPNSQWLNNRLFLRVLGGNATDYQFYPCVLKENFDGVIFINSTSSSKTLLKTNLN